MFGATRFTDASRVMRILSSAVIASLAVVLAACVSPSGDKSDGKTITIALSSPMSSSWVAFAVANEQGYFADEGISVELQFPGGSGDVLQSMEVGRTDLGAPTPEAILAGIDQGQDLSMTYAWTRGPVQSLAVKDESPVEDFGDLKGKTVGVSTLASGAKILAEACLELKGLDPEEDVNFIAVGTGAAGWDALERDRVDALMLWDTEYATMENVGADLRTIRPEEVNDLFSTTFVATDEWLKENPEDMKGFGRAWTKATVWANANPEAAVRSMWEQFPETVTTDDRETLLQDHVRVFEARNEVVTLGQPAASNSWGKYDVSAIEHWIRFAAKYGITDEKLDPGSVYTNEFVESYNDFSAAEVRKSAKSQSTS